MDDLQGGRQPLPDEVRAQDRVAVEEALPGPAERLLVHLAPQRPGQLQEVGLGAGLEPGVEEQALLHRGQGVDVLHLPVGPEQGVDRLLVEPGQGEVGRGEAPGPGREAVLDEGGQAAQEGLRQSLHRLPVVQGGAVEPLQAQPALDHAAVDLQDVAAGPGGGGGGTGGLAGQAEGRILGGRLIELAQVVEADLGRRHGLQRGSGREVPQEAVADPVAGDGAELLLDRLEVGPRIFWVSAGPGRGAFRQREAHGEDRGEPAHGAREVGPLDHGLAPVPFEVDQQGALPGPGGEGLGQGGEEGVVDPRAVGRRHVLQQGPGGVGLQNHLHRPGAVLGVRHSPPPVAPAGRPAGETRGRWSPPASRTARPESPSPRRAPPGDGPTGGRRWS